MAKPNQYLLEKPTISRNHGKMSLFAFEARGVCNDSCDASVKPLDGALIEIAVVSASFVVLSGKWLGEFMFVWLNSNYFSSFTVPLLAHLALAAGYRSGTFPLDGVFPSLTKLGRRIGTWLLIRQRFLDLAQLMPTFSDSLNLED